MNRAAQHIQRLYPKRGAQVRLAKEVGISQGYLSRLMSAEQTPGVGVRRLFFSRLKIRMEWWDQEARPSAAEEGARG